MDSNFDTSFYQNFYCQISIKGLQVIPQNIISLVIRESIFDILPRLELIMNDDGMLVELFTIEDNDEIKVVIGKDPTDKNPFIGKFLIQDVKVNEVADNKGFIISMTGVPNFPTLFTPKQSRSFRNKSSKDVTSQIVQECGMIFNTSSGFKTTDTMTWLQVQSSNYEFLYHLKMYSYRPEDPVFLYMNLPSIMRMTSFQTELFKEDIKQARYNPINTTASTFDNKVDENTIWFNYYDYVNFSGYLNKTNNYGLSYSWYNMESTIQKKLSDSSKPISKQTFKNKDLIGKTSEFYTFGFVNNTHDNFYKGAIENDYYTKNLFPLSLMINMNAKSNVKLFDKLMVVFPSTPFFKNNEMNEFLTGTYFVVGLVNHVSKGNVFIKQAILSKNGFNKSSFQKSYTNG